jgi:hypothetical protein
MKRITLSPLAVLFVILLCACSNDTQELTPASTPLAVKLKVAETPVGNKDNPYDDVGLKFRNFLSDYKVGAYNPTTYSEVYTIVQSLTGASSTFGTISTQDLLSACKNAPDIALFTILEQSTLSQTAKDTLSTVIGNYENWSHQPFDQTYGEIAEIEANVLNSPTLSENDQRVILSVTSVARYSLYHSCCEDTDWEKSVGNIVAALAGSRISSNTAIQYALITSIAGLEEIQF